MAVTRLVALGPSLAVCIATGSDTGLFNAINEWLNILQSIQLPFAMLPILHFSSDPRVMRRFTNGRASKAAVYALAIPSWSSTSPIACSSLTRPCPGRTRVLRIGVATRAGAGCRGRRG